MLQVYVDSVVRTMVRIYILPEDIKPRIEQFLASQQPEEQIIEKFIQFLNTLEKIKDKNNADSTAYKTQFILDNFPGTPTSILDIGAGTAAVAVELKKKYNLQKQNVFVLDLQPIESDEVSVVRYTPQMKIPLPNKSVHLIIMFSLLHHVPNSKLLLEEVDRVLAANGYVIIREHDALHTREYRIYLQLIHYAWYVRNNEPYDPLILMSKKELTKIFAGYGWEPTRQKTQLKSNLQRMYMQVFKRRVFRQ